MSAARQTGGCLCGAVRFEAWIEAEKISACHCRQCQQWSGGGPYFAVRVRDVDMTGDAAIALYHASGWGERGFCKTCGATLFWRRRGGETSTLAAGLFDDQAALAVTGEIFTDHRPPWLPAWPNATQSTEAEELAKLNAALKGDIQ